MNREYDQIEHRKMMLRDIYGAIEHSGRFVSFGLLSQPMYHEYVRLLKLIVSNCNKIFHACVKAMDFFFIIPFSI